MLYALLALMIPMSLVLAFTVIPGGFLLTVIFASINGIVHELSRKSRECDYDTVNYSVATIQALERIKKLHDPVLDAAIATASWRRTLTVCCVPEVHFDAEEPFAAAKGMVHPLLTHAIPNDLDLRRCLLITGSNASGKSTYLKTAALCVLLAQALCVAPCESYAASAFRLYTSMALADHLLSGESCYIAETKALKRILD